MKEMDDQNLKNKTVCESNEREIELLKDELSLAKQQKETIDEIASAEIEVYTDHLKIDYFKMSIQNVLLNNNW